MNNALNQGLRFLLSGGLAFATDAAVLTLLTRGVGLDPYSARIVAICCAMLVGFFAHRHISFSVGTAPTLAEFTKFLSVAMSASLINYAVYAAALFFHPATEPLVALVAATAVAMGYSYLGYRFGVFRKPEA